MLTRCEIFFDMLAVVVVARPFHFYFLKRNLFLGVYIRTPSLFAFFIEKVCLLVLTNLQLSTRRKIAVLVEEVDDENNDKYCSIVNPMI